MLEKAEVPSGRIYSIADIAADLHYQARGMIERHKLGDRELLLPGIVPKLSDTPGGTRWIGPRLGEHTDEVLRSLGTTTRASRPARIRRRLDVVIRDGLIGSGRIISCRQSNLTPIFVSRSCEGPPPGR